MALPKGTVEKTTIIMFVYNYLALSNASEAGYFDFVHVIIMLIRLFIQNFVTFNY